MKRILRLMIFSLLTAFCMPAEAQYVNRETSPAYYGSYTEQPQTDNDSSLANGPRLTVIQPEALKRRIESHRHAAASSADENLTLADSVATSAEHSRQHGFRIQVFSDNNQKTAQGEARSKERRINEMFPEYETYIVYNSPYWRLKVGDFKTEFEAETAADAIKRSFPEFAREVRIVRDRINVAR